MTRRLSPRHRRTHLGQGVGRAVGFYEQCDDRSPSDSASQLLQGAHVGSLVAFGMVGHQRRLGHHVLRSLAGTDHLSDFDARTVPISRLLSEVRLDADADLIMWHGTDGAQIATPVARLLDDDTAELVLGGADLDVAPCWSESVIIRSTSLSSLSEMRVVAMTAMTFTQFIGGAR